jgi:hypothetical protein
MGTINFKNKKAGFVILFAVTLAALLLAVAVGAANIAYKEAKFATSTKNTGNAFTAADTGAECALMNDLNFNGTGTSGIIPGEVMQCGGNPATVYNPDAHSLYRLYVSGLAGGQGCAIVDIDKNNPQKVVITSKGYSSGSGGVDVCVPNNNSVERVLEYKYPAPSAVNYALGATATASSTYCFDPPACTSSPGFAANNAVKGNRTGANWGNGGGWSDNTSDDFSNDWLQVDFGSQRNISEIDIFMLQDGLATNYPTKDLTSSQYGLTNFKVQYSNDGINWNDVPGASVTEADPKLVWRQFTFSPITTQNIRLKVNNALGHRSRIVDLEAY